jgi:hypothetical protein
MKKYVVKVPIIGRMTVIVEAENGSQAIELALITEACDPITLKNGVEELNFEAVKKAVEGNVFYGEVHEAEVEEINC